jgi:hypothetical protein
MKRVRKGIDISGQRFGRLVAIEFVPKGNDCNLQGARWRCRCDCGNETITSGARLRFGQTKSCGCLSRERASVWCKAARTKHGASRSALYDLWCAMIQRCEREEHQHYHRYGGRGIKVCERWRHDFDAFRSDMGERPSRAYSIDRIDNDGDYEPGNCRWATRKEQGTNRSATRHLTHQGRTGTIDEWAERSGVSRTAIHCRLQRGWTVEEALTRPLGWRPKTLRPRKGAEARVRTREVNP